MNPVSELPEHLSLIHIFPGTFMAFSVLISSIHAWAWGLRRTFTTRQSFGARSSVYTGWPVTRAMASFFLTGLFT